MSKRFDKRTKKQFKKDIQECTRFEKVLFEKYLGWLASSMNLSYLSWVDSGTDNSGKFIEKDNKVILDADYTILYPDGNLFRVEVKHCKPSRPCFHIKLHHLKYCIENNITIINWMGTSTDNPKFCILSPEILKEALNNNKHTYFWDKPVVKFINKDYSWITMSKI